MTTVLICDDHLIVRQGIKQILADTGDIVVVEEADNGPDAIRKTREASAAPSGGIDVVMMDIAMPHRDGLDVRSLGGIRKNQRRISHVEATRSDFEQRPGKNPGAAGPAADRPPADAD